MSYILSNNVCELIHEGNRKKKRYKIPMLLINDYIHPEINMLGNQLISLIFIIDYLHHKCDRIECDHRKYEIFKRRRYNERPDTILERVLALGHVATRWTRVDRKVYALFLYSHNK